MKVGKIVSLVFAFLLLCWWGLWFLLEHDNNLDFGEIAHELGSFPNDAWLALGAFVAVLILIVAILLSGRGKKEKTQQ